MRRTLSGVGVTADCATGSLACSRPLQAENGTAKARKRCRWSTARNGARSVSEEPTVSPAPPGCRALSAASSKRFRRSLERAERVRSSLEVFHGAGTRHSLRRWETLGDPKAFVFRVNLFVYSGRVRPLNRVWLEPHSASLECFISDINALRAFHGIGEQLN